jgi:hypothetical protein
MRGTNEWKTTEGIAFESGWSTRCALLTLHSSSMQHQLSSFQPSRRVSLKFPMNAALAILLIAQLNWAIKTFSFIIENSNKWLYRTINSGVTSRSWNAIFATMKG